mgnify:CR=1 FL=1
MQQTSTDPNDVQFSELILMFREGEYNQLLDKIDQIVLIFPNSSKLFNLRAAAYTALDNYELALINYEKAISLNPDYADAYNNLGNLFKSAGKNDEAIQSYKKAIAIKSPFPEAERNLAAIPDFSGNITRNFSGTFPKDGETDNYSDTSQEKIRFLFELYDKGNFDEALFEVKNLIEVSPNLPMLFNFEGMIYSALKNYQSANSSFEKAILLDPHFSQAYNNLGNVFKLIGNSNEALKNYKKAIELRPRYAESLNNAGVIEKENGNFPSSIDYLKRSLNENPEFAEAHNNIGNVYTVQKDFQAAVLHYRKCIEISPHFVEAYNNLAIAYKNVQNLATATEICKKGMQVKSDYAPIINTYGTILQASGKTNEAIRFYLEATHLKKDFPEAHNNLGNAYKQIGNLASAEHHYLKAIELRPNYAEARRNITNVVQFDVLSSFSKQTEAIFFRDKISSADKCHLAFALGKIFEDNGSYEQAFEFYKIGNQQRKLELAYNLKKDRYYFGMVKETFSSCKELDYKADLDFPKLNKVPFFILGMPRSGTTLVEQIISSHPEVYGAGELPILADGILKTDFFNSTNFVQNIRNLRNYYNEKINDIPSDEPFITDKMPLNFLYIGAIVKALPEAKIISVRRDPIATCWSNYRHYFSNDGNRFAYNLNDLAEFYIMYEDLMAFWQNNLADKIYDLNYESLTERQFAESQKLINYLGLVWDDKCLKFFENKRAVHTASSMQVRQKMFRGSSLKWKNFEPFLEDLIDTFNKDIK